MNPPAIVTFLIIAAFIWGGLALILTVGFRREAEKRRAALTPANSATTTAYDTHRGTES